MRTVFIYVLTSLVVGLGLQSTCNELQCEVCCIGRYEASYCTDDKLICILQTSTDFTILMYSIIIVFGFLIGLPVLLLVFEFVVLRRIGCIKMSLCKIITTMFCCCRLKRKRNQQAVVNKANMTRFASKRLGKGAPVVEME